MFKNIINKKVLASLVLVITISTYIGITAILNSNNAVETLSRYGSRGNEVIQIQTKLKRWGYYNGSIDGIYGTQTLNAVKYFQRKNGLTVDRNSRN